MLDIQAYRESAERYRILFDVSPAAVYTIDADGVIRPTGVRLPRVK